MLKKASLALGSLILCLLGIEAWLRLSPHVPLQLNNPYRYVHVSGFVRFEPSWAYQETYPLDFDPRGYYRKSEGVILYQLDQLSARWSGERRKQAQKKTILALGDSFTYGFGLRFEDTYPQLLARRLGADVVNLARPAADVESSLALYREKRGLVPHQALLYGLHLNDLVDFPTSYAQTNPRLDDRSFWQRNFRALPYLLEKWDLAVLQPARIRAIADPGTLKRPRFTKNFAALREMHALAQEKKLGFRVVLLPVLVGLKEKTFTPLFTELRAKLEQAGMPYIDLSEGWESYRDQDLWITPFDQHPNEVANAIFADRLEKAFKDSPLFPATKP